MAIRRKPRRGVLLLLVLSLLVLFALIGTTFIIVAGRYDENSRRYSDLDRVGTDPAEQLNSVMMDLLRGPSGRSSILTDENLLRDLYGDDRIEGRVANSVFEANGQFIRMSFVQDGFPDFHLTPDYYSGCVLTMLSGEHAGKSTRIVRFMPRIFDASATPPNLPTPVTPNSTLVVESFGSSLPSRTDRFVINGRPFNGYGAGFRDTSGRLDASTNEYNQSISAMDAIVTAPIALLPNYKRDPLLQLLDPALTGSDYERSFGGVDESWDAPDYQNLFLGMHAEIGDSSSVTIPSFHRPYLVNYWMHRENARYRWSQVYEPNVPAALNPEIRPYGSPSITPIDAILADKFRRDMVVRPLPTDHPRFSGSNPAFAGPFIDPEKDLDGDHLPDCMDPDPSDPMNATTAATTELANMALVRGPWDVDNDNDGTPDSVWVDLGYPVEATKDGRLYKPLFAILCLDMDGRLNVNGHGSTDQILIGPNEMNEFLQDARPAIAGVAPPQLPDIRGLGFGPADIKLFDPPWDSTSIFATQNASRQLLRDRYRSVLDPLPGPPPFPGSPLLPGDLLNNSRQAHYPFDYSTQVITQFGQPTDLSGTDYAYFDAFGQPVYITVASDRAANTVFNDSIDDPYEKNLNEPNATDALYSVAELEGVLRYFDDDAIALPSRLRSHLNMGFDSPTSRLVTTRSFSIPTPNASVHYDDDRTGPGLDTKFDAPVQQGFASPEIVKTNSVPALLYKKLRKRKLDDGATLEEAHLFATAQMQIMLPPEILSGQKMDLNRFFGNGVDDDGDFVVDEPGEGLFLPPYMVPQTGGVIGLASEIDSVIGLEQGTLARQRFARHLFCLAMLMMDEGYDLSSIGSTPNIQQLEATPLSDTDAKKLRIRRIAQWAINVVDFRDSDSIMTPFEYDEDPFDADGWEVDHDISRLTAADGVADDRILPARGLVWGMEQPDLLLQETVAFHDRRARDTASEGAGDDDVAAVAGNDDPDPKARVHQQAGMYVDGDDTLDQDRIPQGSMFVELLSPKARFRQNSGVFYRGGNRGTYPRELYRVDGNNAYLQIGKLAPENNAGIRYPVWRIAVVEHDLGKSVQQYSQVNGDTVSFDPNDMNLLTTAPTERLPIDRIIWFAAGNVGVDGNGNGINGIAPGTIDAQKIFWNHTPAAQELAAGWSSILGPRPITEVIPGGTQRFEFTDGPFIPPAPTTRFEQTGSVPYQSERSLSMIIAASAVNWTTGTPAERLVGLNVSEPVPGGASYYPTPTDMTDKSYSPPRDLPLDMEPTAPLANIRDNTGTPIERIGKGTVVDYKTLMLQRLANPTLPWNPDPSHPDHDDQDAVNPYITVDWMPVDLTIYNSRDDEPMGVWEDVVDQAGLVGPAALFDGAYPDTMPAAPQVQFTSRRRTGRLELKQGANPSTEGIDAGIAWSSRSDLLLGAAGPNTADAPYLEEHLSHSFGDMNPELQLNSPIALPAARISQLPQIPFPGLVWNNRPYASSLELMQVPAASASRLSFEFTTRLSDNEYDANGNLDAHLGPFGHLMNFFQSTGPQTEDEAPNLARLFDVVHVPSRFVGSSEVYNPSTFNGASLSNALPAGVSPDLSSFAFPFNVFSRFREPAKVNINTINDERVWRAIDPTITWEDVKDSRQGPGDISDLPSRYSFPFRSAATSNLMPTGSLSQPPALSGLVRPDNGGNDALFQGQNTFQYDNASRNALSHFRNLQRLDNLITTQSNVFAVWITVGYFEVHPWNAQNPFEINVTPVPDSAHPDGYQLGQEIGIDTGEVERHRAFYIIDRSIPVAFEPGENHNVEDAILLKRFIE